MIALPTGEWIENKERHCYDECDDHTGQEPDEVITERDKLRNFIEGSNRKYKFRRKDED